jgi:ferredoxin-NADP reductase
MAQPVHFKVVVEQNERHDANVVSYRLRADRRLPRFVPGQFIHLTMDHYDPSSFWPESRVFSVANAVMDRRTLCLTIGRQGAYTNRILNEVKVGGVLWGKGPYGEFSVDGSHGYRRAVLIAGGTGITPFCAFMDAALAQGKLPVEEAILHYGARTPELLIYRSLADRCAVQVPEFKVRYYAEEILPGKDSNIQPGCLDVARIVADTVKLDDAAFYLSGPKSMIDAFQTQLIRQHGVAQEQVIIDAWG